MDFPPPYIVDPPHGTAHTHTIILLHGRSSTAQEFATDLFGLYTSKKQESLCDAFPNIRWVFPDAGQRWCTAFQERRSAWFDTVSLSDLSSSQNLQLPGLRSSILLVKRIVESEVDRVGGRANRVILGGFSQGSAVALWSVFTGVAGLNGDLGAFVGLSAWMPFTQEATRIMAGSPGSSPSDCRHALQEGIAEILEGGLTASPQEVQVASKLPVYLGHGTDDALIDIENCYQVTTIFTAVGAVVEAREYTGAGREGHWIKEPEQIDDIVAFIGKVFDGLGL